jgi:NTP pyrophosphatase (non-canonical NTP hydrolase)
MGKRAQYMLEEIKKRDSLEVLFELQSHLMEMGDYSKVDINTKEGQKLLREMAGYVTEELYEGINCLKNRQWTKNHVPTDFDHYKEELIDSFSFMLQLMIMSGIDKDMLLRTFIEKYLVNKFREVSGY